MKKTSIAHHEKRKLEIKKLAEASQEELGRDIARLATSPELIEGPRKKCRERFYTLAYLNRPEAIDALADYVEMLLAHLVLTTNVGKDTSYTFRDKVYRLTPVPRENRANLFVWNTAFLAAKILQCDAYLSELMAISPDELLTAAAEPKTFSYELMAAYQSFHEKRSDWATRITEAVEATVNLPQDDLRFYDAALYRDGPAFDLLFIAITKSEADYQTYLREAVGSHKKYAERWGDEAEGPSLLISLPVTWTAVIARRIRGYTCTLKTAYLPPVLLDYDGPFERTGRSLRA